MADASVNVKGPSPSVVPRGSGRADAVVRVLAIITLAGVGLQFLLAGFGAFGGGFEVHTMTGRALSVVVLALLIAVLVAKPGRADVTVAIVVFVLAFFGQTLFAALGVNASSWFGALHAINGLAIGGLTSRLLAGASERQKRRQQTG